MNSHLFLGRKNALVRVTLVKPLKKILSDYTEIKKIKATIILISSIHNPAVTLQALPRAARSCFLRGCSGDLPGTWSAMSPGGTETSSDNCTHPALGKGTCKWILGGCLLLRKIRSRVQMARAEASLTGGWLGGGQGPEHTHRPHLP